MHRDSVIQCLHRQKLNDRYYTRPKHKSILKLERYDCMVQGQPVSVCPFMEDSCYKSMPSGYCGNNMRLNRITDDLQ